MANTVAMKATTLRDLRQHPIDPDKRQSTESALFSSTASMR